jgi:hypothetical protein
MWHAWGNRNEHRILMDKSEKRKRPLGRLDLDAEIILKLILEKYYGVVWAGFIWLRLGASGGIL